MNSTDPASGAVPVLWITGPAGVGKSTASWQLFTELAGEGVRVAFADADQLCMCYPAPQGDPLRERIKAENVGALVPGYRDAGAQCVIVNGCVDPVKGIYTELMPHVDLTICRLRAAPDELTRRYVGREGASDNLDELIRETLTEAESLDASSFADVCVDTTGVSAVDVAGLVRDHCRDWPGFSVPVQAADSDAAEHAESADGADGADGSILLLCGAMGVGKSTAGFDLFVRSVRAGRKTGYVDLDQLGFIRPESGDDPGNHRLRAANLAAVWRTYHAAGARHLVATGPVDSDEVIKTYQQAVPAASVTVCRLHAGPSDLTERILSRACGGSWPQPGDPLSGKSAEQLRVVAQQAAAAADALERADVGTFRIDTAGRPAVETADLVAAATSWPV